MRRLRENVERRRGDGEGMRKQTEAKSQRAATELLQPPTIRKPFIFLFTLNLHPKPFIHEILQTPPQTLRSNKIPNPVLFRLSPLCPPSWGEREKREMIGLVIAMEWDGGLTEEYCKGY